jgi:hypothetical protein
VRFTVEDPDACEREASDRGLTVVWPTQDAAWGRFVVLADPDGRAVVLAKMRPIGPPEPPPPTPSRKPGYDSAAPTQMAS